MFFTELRELAEQMQILRLHCTFVFKQKNQLDEFKGSTLHGWLGRQLHKEDRELFDLLYGEHDQQQPKPYAISCYDHRTEFVENAILSFTLTLFGGVVQFADRLVTALSHKPLGFGKLRAAIALHSVASQTPFGLRLGIRPLPLVNCLEQRAPNLVHSCSLQLLSPLRLKEEGRIVKQGVPALADILVHTQRRLAYLVRYWVNEDPKWQEAIRRPILLGEHQSLESAVYYEDWLRYSNTQQRLLPFGGLMGELSYTGDIYHALQWLQVGQLLQIGGKTTFGLGCYQVLS